MTEIHDSIQRKNAARLVFVQALYGAHFDVPILSAEDWVEKYKQDQLATHIENVEEDENSDEIFQLKPEIEPDMKFLRKLLRAWLEEKPTIEYQLAMQLDAKDKRRYSRLSPLIQAVLGSAALELMHLKAKPPVILKEYTEVAAGFFDNPELGYINGTLQELVNRQEL